MSEIGHNQPPLRETVLGQLDDRLADFAVRRQQFLDSCARVERIRDQQDVDDAADTAKLAMNVWDLIHQERVKISQPLRDAADALGHKAANFWLPVDQAIEGLRDLVRAYYKERDQRIADQRLEQEREDARLAALRVPVATPSPAPTPALPATRSPGRRTRTVGDLGGRVVDVEQKTYTVTDVRLVPLEIMNSPKVTAAIVAVVRDFSKHMSVIPGIRVDTQQDLRIGV